VSGPQVSEGWHGVRREAFVWAAPPKDAAACDTPESALYYQTQSAMYAPLLAGEEVMGVVCVDNQITCDAFYATDLELLRALAGRVAVFVRDRVHRRAERRESALAERLGQQFPPRVARMLAQRYGRRQVGGEKVDPVTILVSDVRGFTRMSRRMDPDDVVRMLNEMFDALVPIVLENDGVVDKFVGDSVLAVFGSPERDDEQWEKAVRAAMEMQAAVRKLGESRRVRRLPLFEIGVSVHSGEVIHGFIGSSMRMEYTIIGDAVNRASRYCDGAGAGEVLISPAVYEHVYGLVDVAPKSIRTKHADTEPDLDAYLVRAIRSRAARDEHRSPSSRS